MPYKFQDMVKFGPELVLGTNPVSSIDPKKKDHKKALQLVAGDLQELTRVMNLQQLAPEVQGSFNRILSEIKLAGSYKYFYDFYVTYWIILTAKVFKLSVESNYEFLLKRLQDLIFNEEASIRLTTNAEIRYYKGEDGKEGVDAKIEAEIQKRLEDVKERKKYVERMKQFR